MSQTSSTPENNSNRKNNQRNSNPNNNHWLPVAFRVVLKGFTMGAADLVPGVSGATIALLLGIYGRFITALSDIATTAGQFLGGNYRPGVQHFKQVEWKFILPLAGGIATAIIGLSYPARYLLENHPQAVAGVFCGVVLASILATWSSLPSLDLTSRLGLKPRRQLTTMLRMRVWQLLLAITVATGLFVGLGFGSGTLSSPSAAIFLASGAVAVCAMVLPGISGAFVLLLIGMYAPVLDALSRFDIALLAAFCAGAAVGAGLFTSLLREILRRYQVTTTAVLLGLLTGSMRVLWPWPNGVGIISDKSNELIDGTTLALPDTNTFFFPTLYATLTFAVLTFAVSSSGSRWPGSQWPGSRWPGSRWPGSRSSPNPPAR